MTARFWMAMTAVLIGVVFVAFKSGRSPRPELTKAEDLEPPISVDRDAKPQGVLVSATPLPKSGSAVLMPPSESEEMEASKKLRILKEILDSNNDNDPRLDREFREIGSVLREKLREFYRELPAEKLNSRGTVVFLLGRDLRGIEDARFFNSVLREPPCLGLERCLERADVSETPSEVTLAYPQIVATTGLVKGWSRIADPDRRAELRRSLEAAAHSPNAALARAARAALSSIKTSEN